MLLLKPSGFHDVRMEPAYQEVLTLRPALLQTTRGAVIVLSTG